MSKRITYVLVPVKVTLLDNEVGSVESPTFEDVKQNYSVLNAFNTKEIAQRSLDAFFNYDKSVDDVGDDDETDEIDLLPVTIEDNGNSHTYAVDSHIRFVRQAQERGLRVQHYNGRNFYKGPAVVVTRDEVRFMTAEFSVPLKWDSFGKSDCILYPG